MRRPPVRAAQRGSTPLGGRGAGRARSSRLGVRHLRWPGSAAVPGRGAEAGSLDEFMAQDRGTLGALLANRHGEAAARACRCWRPAPLFLAAHRQAAAAASPWLLLTAPSPPVAGASRPIPQPVRSRRGSRGEGEGGKERTAGASMRTGETKLARAAAALRSPQRRLGTGGRKPAARPMLGT
ncbi:hypothetical protein MC885_019938 [Smutsia gigantea]|nr:hypothetical protein MC885_019938 [Smutsia gigantea]